MSELKRTILLVEDDPLTALSEKVMLESNGYNVITASSGRRAVDIVCNSSVDLILMDLELGGDLDGHSVAKQILQKRNIPIVFLTAHIEREMVEKVRSITRYGYALKNSGDYVLLSLIEMVFELFEAHERTRINEENYRRLVEDINDMLFSIDEEGFFVYISPRVESICGYGCEELIGKRYCELIYSEDVENAGRKFAALSEGGGCEYESRMLKKNGDIAWVRSSMRAIMKDGRFSGASGILSDITDRKEKEERISILLSEKDDLLREINCLYGLSCIAEKYPSSVELFLFDAVSGISSGFNPLQEVSVMISYSGKEYSSAPSPAGVHSFVCDIIVNRSAIGSVKAFCPDKTFSGRDKRFINTVAERLGRIIELIEAKNELRELEKEIISISERERQKIGREIHDSLGQILTGVNFMLKTVKNNIAASSPVPMNKISEISDLVYEAALICRKITKGLPMQSISQDNLVLAIDQLAINIRNIFEVNCEFITAGEVMVRDDFTSSQLYYITQEAINNAVKHSGAENIRIYLLGELNRIHLSIHDDGKGKSENQSSGIGFNIMKYRSDLIGGEFIAENHQERGFLISVNVPA